MATISVQTALDLAYQAGFRGDSQKKIVAIAQAESGLNAASTSPPNNDAWRSVDRGILQINNHWHPEVTDACAYNATCAFKEGYRISQNGTNFHPWSTYNNGAYLPHYQALQKVTVPGGQTGSGKAWYMYGFGNLFGQGDPGIGGEHGIDIETPPDTPVTFLLGGIITDISRPDYGIRVTWKLDTPWRGIPYAYQIHLDAVNPTLKVGMHINPGDLMGWSGGENSLAQLNGANNPTKTHFVDSAYMSSGPHTEFGFSYGPVYGQGAGFADIKAHPELNPLPFINEVRGGGIVIPGGNQVLDSSFFTGQPTQATGYSSSSAPAVLNMFNDKYSQFANSAHQALASTPGLWGFVSAVDAAEQFPGIYNAFSGDSNPVDAPANAVMSVLHTIGGNVPPFLIRAMIAGFGLILLIGLAMRATEPIREQVAGVATQIAAVAA